MPSKQSPKQREIVGRVMHEFKRGGLESSSGGTVKDPRQAIAIALHEAGASRDASPGGNRRNLARTEAKARQSAAGRKGGGRAGPSRAALLDEAAKRGIPGRSRMTKDHLAKALGRR